MLCLFFLYIFGYRNYSESYYLALKGVYIKCARIFPCVILPMNGHLTWSNSQ